MSTPQTLKSFLSTNGMPTLTKAAAAPAAAAPVAAAPAAKPAVAAPAKVAGATAMVVSDAKGKPAPNPAEPAGGLKPKTPGKTASLDLETATPEQKWLAERDIIITDAKTASIVYAQNVQAVERQKRAELEKNAEELRAQGQIIYQGMAKESMALQYAFGDASELDVIKLASALGIPTQSITKRAEAMRAQMPSPALVGDQLGSAARPSTSAAQSAAEQNGNTTQFTPEAVAGTRAPVSSTSDAKLHRFEDTYVLPGNPGLNQGMNVSQGKAPGA